MSRGATAQSVDTALSMIEVQTGSGTIGGFSIEPKGARPFPVVLLAVEKVGSPERMVAESLDRLAKEGFLAVASDLFVDDPSDERLMQRLDATRDWAAKNGGDISRLGIVGFGPGGRVAWLYDAHSPTLKAAVSWYGPMQGAPSPARPMSALEAAPQLHAPLLGLYGKNDGTPQRVLLDAESKARQAGRTAEIVAYVGAGSNFAVPGSAAFDQAATLDGWIRTLAWLRAHGAT